MTRARNVIGRVRRHPLAADAGLAVVLALLVVSEILGSDVTGSPALLVPAGLAMTLPLALRRKAPLPAALVVFASFATLGAIEGSGQEPQTPLIGILLAAYSVGAHSERREALAGLAAAIAAILVREAGDVIVMGPVFAGAWLAGRLVRARESDALRLRELSEALERERVEEGRLAAAEERARIARELHDVVAHAMSTIVLEAGAERVNLGEGRDSTRQVLRSIERTGRQALAEMRRLVGVLRREDEEAALLPQPSLARLDELVQHVGRAGLPVEVRVVGEPVELAPGLDISAYRIVQEALTNVLKHAGPASATVAITYGARDLGIEVSDDGRGGAGNGGGHGLTGLRERATLFGGELEAGGADGNGFVVRARLPLEGRR